MFLSVEHNKPVVDARSLYGSAAGHSESEIARGCEYMSLLLTVFEFNWFSFAIFDDILSIHYIIFQQTLPVPLMEWLDATNLCTARPFGPWRPIITASFKTKFDF